MSIFLYGKKIVCANVGDSRAVLGSLKQIEEAKQIRDSIKAMRKKEGFDKDFQIESVSG